MANDFKIRMDNGTPPYNGTVKDFADNLLYTITNAQADEIPVPDSGLVTPSGGIKINLTDSNGKTNTKYIGNGQLLCLKNYWVGISVANGNPEAHKNAILDGEANGFNYTGVMLEFSNIKNDAELIALEAMGEFDASLPLPSEPLFHFDKTIWYAWNQTTCKHIRINKWIRRNGNVLNNGSTITQFIDFSHSQMRHDGVTPLIRASGNELNDIVITSYFPEQVFNSTARITKAIYKRYKRYFLDGTIIGDGIVASNNGEGEICFNYGVGNTVEDYNGDTRTNGDFHPESMSKFYADFPAWASKTKDEIYHSLRDTALYRDWYHHNQQGIIDFEIGIGQAVVDEIPEFQNLRFQQIDSGSWLDELAHDRKTFNIDRRAANPFVSLFKSNDGPDYGPLTLDFYLDQISSVARRYGCSAIVEPSPPLPYENPDHFGHIVSEMQRAYARGVGISFFTPNTTLMNSLLSAAGIVLGSVPKNKQEYVMDGINKRVHRHEVPLDQVIRHGAFGGAHYWRDEWEDERTTTGIAHVATHTYDNVNPPGGIGTP